MEDKIRKVISDIDGKKNNLIKEAEASFAGLILPVSTNVDIRKPNKQTPPITYILYGVAGLTVIGGFCAVSLASRLACFGIAAASAYGGYSLGGNRPNTQKVTEPKIDIASLKFELTSKVLDIVKKIKASWEEFMENQQKVVQRIIQNSNLNEDSKNYALSKVAIFEVIDVKMSEFNSRINSVNNVETAYEIVKAFENKVISAISFAAKKQSAKYESVLMVQI